MNCAVLFPTSMHSGIESYKAINASFKVYFASAGLPAITVRNMVRNNLAPLLVYAFNLTEPSNTNTNNRNPVPFRDDWLVA